MRKSFCITLALAVFLSASAYAQTVRVITKKNSIRKECNFFSRVVAPVKHDDTLRLLSRKGDWLWVELNYKRGCIHKSAVEEKKVSLAGLLGGPPQAGATEDEVSLAGKGFNPQVESSYKQKNPELRFNLVDRIEGYEVSGERLKKFMKNGGLSLP